MGNKGRGVQFIPAFTNKDIEEMVERYKKNLEEMIITLLTAAGEYFVGEARKNGAYKDRTGNLRSSIGYILIKDSQVLIKSDFEPVKVMAQATFTDEAGKYHPAIKESVGTMGSDYGKTFIQELIDEYPYGIVLIGVAGMNYAEYVERIHSLDVITGATLKTQEYIRKSIQDLKSKISR